MRQVQFQAVSSKAPAELEAHRAYSRSLGLSPPKALAEKLAIVGGGASALRHIEELRAWNGEVWAVNGAARWCADNLIDAALFSASPAEWPSWYTQGISRAILADTCPPSTFDAMSGAEVSIFDNDDNGPTSTVGAMMLAMNSGASEIHFFGCEGSYGATTHHYQHAPIASDMIVQIGGVEHRTNVGYFLQSQLLAHALKSAPDYFKDRSGGLLGLLVSAPEDWDVVKLPSELKDAA